MLFLYLILYSILNSTAMISIMTVFCTIIRVLTISWLIQINKFQEGVCKNNGCFSPMTICSYTFRTNKLTGCLIESSVNITININISKISITMLFLRKMKIENAKKKKLTIKKTKFLNKACKTREQKYMVSVCGVTPCKAKEKNFLLIKIFKNL